MSLDELFVNGEEKMEKAIAQIEYWEIVNNGTYKSAQPYPSGYPKNLYSGLYQSLRRSRDKERARCLCTK